MAQEPDEGEEAIIFFLFIFMKLNREVDLRRVDELGPITDGCRRFRLPGERRPMGWLFWLLPLLALGFLAGVIVVAGLSRA